MSPARIFEASQSKLFNFNFEKAKAIAQKMEAGLYGNEEVDAHELRKDLFNLISRTKYVVPKKEKFDLLPGMNP